MLHLEIHAPPAQNNPLELAVEALRDPQPLLFALGENLLHSTRERFARQESPEGLPWQALSPRYAARKPALLSNRARGKGRGSSRARGKSGTRGSTARGSATQGILRLFGHMKVAKGKGCDANPALGCPWFHLLASCVCTQENRSLGAAVGLSGLRRAGELPQLNPRIQHHGEQTQLVPLMAGAFIHRSVKLIQIYPNLLKLEYR